MSTPQQVAQHVLASNTTLYTAFTGGTRSMAVTLNFCNTTTADITVDVFLVNAAGSDSFYLVDDLVIPAKGTRQFTGIVVFATAAETLKAIASATGVDILGAVVENA